MGALGKSVASRTAAAAPLLLLAALAAAGLAFAEFHGWTGPWRPWLGVLVGFLGAGLGALLIATPVEPSPIKLMWLASALSPFILLGLLAAGLRAFDGDLGQAWTATYCAVTLLSLIPLGRRMGAERPGPAMAASLLLAALVGAGLFFMGSSDAGLAARLGSPGAMAHVAVADAWGRGVPMASPWIFDGATEVRPVAGGLLSVLGRALGVDPFYALIAVRAWAASLLVLAGYLGAAAAFREAPVSGRSAAIRDLVAAVLVPAALWIPIRPGEAPDFPGQDPALLLGGTALTLGLVTGLHAVRRGARPWTGLAVIFVAMGATLVPWSGLAAGAALCAAAMISGRPTLAVMALGALVPALAVGRASGGFSAVQIAPAGSAGAWSQGWLAAAALAALGAPAWRAARARRRAEPVPGAVGGSVDQPNAGAGSLAHRSTADGSLADVTRDDGPAAMHGLWLLAAWATMPLLLAALGPGAAGDREMLCRIALVPAALLAAGGASVLGAQRCGAQRSGVHGSSALGLALSGALVLAAGWGTSRAAEREISTSAVPFIESPRGGPRLDAPSPYAVALAPALAWLAQSEHADDPRAALLITPESEGALPITPILSGMALWGSGGPPPGDGQDRTGASAPGHTALGDNWESRRDLLVRLFVEERGWTAAEDRILRAELSRGTRLLALVTEGDRRLTTDNGTGPRGPDMILKRLGAEPIFEAKDVVIYMLAKEMAAR